MAKFKTSAELREEARALIEKAKKQEQELIKKALEMEETMKKELGDFVLKQAKSQAINVDSILTKIEELGL